MIVRLPWAIPLDRKDRSPMVMLLGAESGSWQRCAAKVLNKHAKCVIRTDVETYPKGQLHPSDQWMWFKEYFLAADIIVMWCGDDADMLYLNEWMWVTFAITRYPGKLCLGMVPRPDHPMAPALAFLACDQGIGLFNNLDDTLAMAAERCRSLRNIDHG